MISFKTPKSKTTNFINYAIDHLKSEGIEFNVIKSKDADRVSKANSKAMVLMSFVKTSSGDFQITVKDKEFYRFTKKLLGGVDHCRMNIVDQDESKRTVTAETDKLGKALDALEAMAYLYNLSIVEDGKI